MDSSLFEVLRAPSVTQRKVHLQLEAINTNFLLFFLHTRNGTRCTHRLGNGEKKWTRTHLLATEYHGLEKILGQQRF